MTLFEPVTCTVDIARGGLDGATGRYEKRLSELGGLYADEAGFTAALAYGDRIVYAVEDYRPSSRANDMIFGVTRMLPGKIGREYFMTRGHIHAKSNRPELYYGQKGRGLMLMESPDGEVRVAEIAAGSACYVPPFWIHRSINNGDDDLVMLFAYPADSGQDYEVIGRTGGMRKRVVDDGKGGWTLIENSQYRARSSTEIEALLRQSA
jgi:glucose-6-phosphate isomerase, archaeal